MLVVQGSHLGFDSVKRKFYFGSLTCKVYMCANVPKSEQLDFYKFKNKCLIQDS